MLAHDGLRVDSARLGDFTARVEADTGLREQVDAVFVTVKQTGLISSLDRVPPKTLGGGVVVPLLNGVDHLAQLRRRYHGGRIVGGTIKVSTARTAPAHIVHSSPFADLELAAPVDDLVGALRKAGLKVSMRSDESATLWDKLAFLAPLALLTTRYGATADAVRDAHRLSAPSAPTRPTAARAWVCGWCWRSPPGSGLVASVRSCTSPSRTLRPSACTSRSASACGVPPSSSAAAPTLPEAGIRLQGASRSTSTRTTVCPWSRYFSFTAVSRVSWPSCAHFRSRRSASRGSSVASSAR